MQRGLKLEGAEAHAAPPPWAITPSVGGVPSYTVPEEHELGPISPAALVAVEHEKYRAPCCMLTAASPVPESAPGTAPPRAAMRSG